MAPSTGISLAHISGTTPMPIRRAASAGNTEVRSSVAVNRMLIRSPVSTALRSSIAESNRSVASNTCSGVVGTYHDGPTGRTNPHPVLLEVAGAGCPGGFRLPGRGP